MRIDYYAQSKYEGIDMSEIQSVQALLDSLARISHTYPVWGIYFVTYDVQVCAAYAHVAYFHGHVVWSWPVGDRDWFQFQGLPIVLTGMEPDG